jgi:acyl-CoA synthetase (AMP-forming)/AMP-acid ligase II
MTRFTEAFGRCGFRFSAFRPSYGLAEATLIVSAGLPNREPLVRRFDRERLNAGEVEEQPEGGQGAIELVSCGKWQGGTNVEIVNPDTGRLSSAKTVGEVWIRGESVALGYYDQEGERQRTFAVFVEGDGPYCRTGDLGFIYGGELFVSGRMKDLVVVNGLNHHAEDIEQTVQESDARLGRTVVVFPAAEAEQQRIIVVAEVQHMVGCDLASADLEAVVRRAVYERHQLRVQRTVLTRAGAIPKTTSGKVCRRECRRRFLAGELTAIGEELA